MSSHDSLDRLDQVCDAFEQAWRSGTPPSLEAFLAQAPDAAAARGTWFEELLRLDVHYQQQTGHPVTANTYIRRFPDLKAIITRVLAGEGPGTGCPGPKQASTPPTTGGGASGRESRAKPPSTTSPRGSRRAQPAPTTASPDDTNISVANTALEHRGNAKASGHKRPRQPTAPPDDHTIILDRPATSRLWSAAFAPPPDFEIIKPLGRGTLGLVCKARQVSRDRIVALKLIPQTSQTDAAVTQRFREAAHAIATLRHPGIVAIHEVGEHAGQVYLVMDYFEGGNLAQHKRCGPLEPERAAATVQRLASALDYAHVQGLLHLNLKPTNVLLDESGTPLLSDFGLAAGANAQGSSITVEALPVVPSYAAPEQAPGRPTLVGPATDVHALGTILYELLTGCPPFQADTDADTWQQVLAELPTAPRQLNAKVPEALEAICLQCLAKHPADRYATAGELAEELARYARGEPIRMRRLGPLGKLWRWCTR